MEFLIKGSVSVSFVYIGIALLLLLRIVVNIRFDSFFLDSQALQGSRFKKNLRKLYIIFAEWGDALLNNLYVVLGVLATLYLLCHTDTGIDVTEYMVEKRSSKGLFGNLAYTFLLYFFTFVWAIVNWITPQYDMTRTELKELQKVVRKTNHRILGVSPFFVIALSLGIDRSNTAEGSHWHLIYVLLLFFFIALFILLLNYEYKIIEHLKSQNSEADKEYIRKADLWLKKLTVLCIILSFIMWIVVAYCISGEQLRAYASQILGFSFMFLSFLFWFMAIWFDSKLTEEIVYDLQKKRHIGWRILFAITNWPGRNAENLNQREILYCFSYRFVVLMGFITAIFFTCAPNIQPVHPYIALIAGISFFIIVIDVLYFAAFKKHFYIPVVSIYLKKWQATGDVAKLIVFILSATILICTFVLNGFYIIDNKTILRNDRDPRTSLQKAFKNWVYARKDIIEQRASNDSFPVFIVAGQGGGSRAAYWMSQALMYLDTTTQWHFIDHCFGISTVSGSSPGTAAMLAFWDKNQRRKHLSSDSLLTQYLQYPRDVFDKNFVTCGIAGNFFGDFIRKQLPFYCFDKYIKDRNKRLREEEAWCVHRALYAPKNCNESGFNFKINISQEKNQDSTWHLHRPFLSFYYDEATNQLLNKYPYFFSNTCNVQTGRRGIASPVLVDNVLFGKAIDVMNPQNTAFNNSYSTNNQSYKRIAPLTLGQASHLAELFPFFSAAATVDTFDYAYVDGGVYENYGLTTAFELYKFCQSFIQQDSVAKKMKLKLYILAVINSQYGEEVKPVNQFTAPFLASYSNHFGGYAEKVRHEVKSILGNTAYREIALDKKIPLTRILTERNMQVMDESLSQEVNKHNDIWTAVKKMYKH